jgi:hypothetical protein
MPPFENLKSNLRPLSEPQLQQPPLSSLVLFLSLPVRVPHRVGAPPGPPKPVPSQSPPLLPQVRVPPPLSPPSLPRVRRSETIESSVWLGVLVIHWAGAARRPRCPNPANWTSPPLNLFRYGSTFLFLMGVFRLWNGRILVCMQYSVNRG